MKTLYSRFYAALALPLSGATRIALLLLVLPLGFSLLLPLWKIRMVAPQYPAGLELQIFAHTVTGDIQEINTLNHYIGMAPINRQQLSELDWLPFAIGAMLLLTLRVAAIGNLRWLIDLSVLFFYFGVFSLGRFFYTLYSFGHNLDPRAPFKIEPFTPVMLGTKQVANFTTQAFPGGASWCMAFVGLVLAVLAAWQLVRGWRQPAPA